MAGSGVTIEPCARANDACHDATRKNPSAMPALAGHRENRSMSSPLKYAVLSKMLPADTFDLQDRN
jgi:hypothetical protein